MYKALCISDVNVISCSMHKHTHTHKSCGHRGHGQWEAWRNSRREDAQELLPVGDVRYCRLCAVEQPQKHTASVGSVAVDLLSSLLGQTTHHLLTTAERNK